MKNGKDRGAVLIVPIDEETGKIALVMDPSKPSPLYWKFPGGGIEYMDIDPQYPFDNYLKADNAARREAREETGLTIRIMRLGRIPKRTHTLYLYIGLADFAQMAQAGDEGEIPRAFSTEEINRLKNFMPGHQAILKMAIEKIST